MGITAGSSALSSLQSFPGSWGFQDPTIPPERPGCCHPRGSPGHGEAGEDVLSSLPRSVLQHLWLLVMGMDDTFRKHLDSICIYFLCSLTAISNQDDGS